MRACGPDPVCWNLESPNVCTEWASQLILVS